MSKPTKSRPRQLTRAELKAFEARQSAEVARGATGASGTTGDKPAARVTPTNRRVHALSRAEEYAIIRSDLRRLLWILAVLTATLVVMTFFLR